MNTNFDAIEIIGKGNVLLKSQLSGIKSMGSSLFESVNSYMDAVIRVSHNECPKVTVITPTTGSEYLHKAIE